MKGRCDVSPKRTNELRVGFAYAPDEHMQRAIDSSYMVVLMTILFYQPQKIKVQNSVKKTIRDQFVTCAC